MKSLKRTLRRLFYLACIAFGVWAWISSAPSRNYKPMSGEAESVVNAILAGLGVTDAQVQETSREEQRRWGFIWIETRRRFEVPSTVSFGRVLKDFETTIKDKPFRHRTALQKPNELRIEIYKGFSVFQRLVLVRSPAKPKSHAPQIAVVIDDVAYGETQMDDFHALGIPLTFAILPRHKTSTPLALKAKGLGHGVLLHLPMEPLDKKNNNPGPAGLYLHMTESELRSHFEKDVASIAGLEGINNHMGSAFTSDRARMKLILGWVKERGLYFMDSHTAPKSVVCTVAKQVGVPCVLNDTFLDNKDDLATIEKQLRIALQLAKSRQRTVAIGHYRRKYLRQALAKMIPEFQTAGVDFVTLTTLYQSAGLLP